MEPERTQLTAEERAAAFRLAGVFAETTPGGTLGRLARALLELRDRLAQVRDERDRLRERIADWKVVAANRLDFALIAEIARRRDESVRPTIAPHHAGTALPKLCARCGEPLGESWIATGTGDAELGYHSWCFPYAGWTTNNLCSRCGDPLGTGWVSAGTGDGHPRYHSRCFSVADTGAEGDAP